MNNFLKYFILVFSIATIETTAEVQIDDSIMNMGEDLYRKYHGPGQNLFVRYPYTPEDSDEVSSDYTFFA